ARRLPPGALRRSRPRRRRDAARMSAFGRHAPDRPTVVIEVDGAAVQAVAGETVATALLAAGRSAFATSGKTGNPLAPWCLMGVCFGCLCEIDGRPQVQACLTPVRDGMIVRTRRSTSE